MKKQYKIIIVGGVIMACYPLLLRAENCGNLPSCPSLGFSVPQSSLTTTCKDKTYLKCPFGDYYFCSAVDDGCPTFVTVDPSLETCTKYCPNNSSKCLTKRTITCSEAVSKANGTLITPTSGSVCGTITKSLYLTGPIKGNCTYQTPEFIQMTVFSADKLPPCQKEMKGEASLEISSIRIKNHAFFDVKTKINNISFSNDQGSVYFNNDADVRSISGYAQSGWIKSINVTVSGDYNRTTKAKLGFYCSGDCSYNTSWDKPKCDFNIDGYEAEVSYLINGGDCEPIVTCEEHHGESFTCKQGY